MLFRGGLANFYQKSIYPVFHLFSKETLFTTFLVWLCTISVLTSVTKNKKPRCAHALHNDQLQREVDKMVMEGAFLQTPAFVYCYMIWLGYQLIYWFVSGRQLGVRVQHEDSKARLPGFEPLWAEEFWASLLNFITPDFIIKTGTRKWDCCGKWGELVLVKPLMLDTW